MRKRPFKGFEEIPIGPDGNPLYAARDARSFEFYLNWLADYLYRPSEAKETMSMTDASSEVLKIELKIAFWIWEHPFDDYPPHQTRPIHADILHRHELSKVLSRVHRHSTRYKLLARFYEELNRDQAK